MIIGVHAAMVLPRQFVAACAAFVGVDIASVIGVFRQTAGGALATLGPLLFSPSYEATWQGKPRAF
jgi:hypothetical protein